jgi:amino acid efflux transporter
LVYCAIALATGGDLQTFILIHTSNMVSIYAAGMIAATLILPRFTAGWFMAVVAAVLSVGLLLLAGANLLPAAVLALAAILVTVWKLLRRSPRPADRGPGDEAIDAGRAADPGALVEVKTTGHAERRSALDFSAQR